MQKQIYGYEKEIYMTSIKIFGPMQDLSKLFPKIQLALYNLLTK